jgi:GAF domain-containing protein/HAMP domain-containing protein
VVMFFQTQAWQMLGTSSLVALGGLTLFIAQRMARRLGPGRAAAAMIAAVVLLIPSFVFLWSGATLDLAAGTLALSITLAFMVVPRRHLAWAGVVSLAGAALAFAIDYWAPLPRFDVSDAVVLRFATLASISVVVLVILWQVASVYQRSGSIRTRLIIAFVGVVLLPSAVSLVASGIRGVQEGRERVYNTLELIADFRETQIWAWVEDGHRALLDTLYTENTIRDLNWMVSEATPPSLRQQAQQELRDRFRLLIVQERRFEEIFLMDVEGRVILSTEVDHEGSIQASQEYFQAGLKGTYSGLTSSDATSEPTAIIFSRPVVDEQGRIVVLAGRVVLKQLEEITRRRAGLGETGELYLVSAERRLLTDAPLQKAGSYVYTDGTEAATIQRTGGRATYSNYRSQPVMGVYRWLPQLGIALLVEQSAWEANSGTYTGLAILGAVAIAGLVVAVAVSLFFTRGIAAPVTNLAQTVTHIAEGNLELVARVEREDEIGTLARAFNAMTGQLRELISSLEERVAERTAHLEKRAVQLQATAEVGQAVASIRDLDELLTRVTQLITQRFGYYHAGVFLLDAAGEYAVLRAANSEGGKRMLARGHRLIVGAQGIVGYVTGTGEPRIALDVGADAVYFDNPDMPATRSEMALPLVAGGRVLGALDVQSTDAAAFSGEDVAVLQILADQLAVAIENARLFAEHQEALDAMRRAYRQMSWEAWADLLSQRRGIGYVCDSHNIIRPVLPDRQSDASPADQAEQPLPPSRTSPPSRTTRAAQQAAESNGTTVKIPIRIRDKAFGMVRLRKADEAGKWTEEEMALVETLAEQLGTALDSARLYEESLIERDRTALLLEVSQRLSADLDFDAVVETVLSFADRLSADAAELFITDTQQETLILRSNLPQRAKLSKAETDELARLILRQGLAGWVLRERQPALIADTAHDERWLTLPGDEKDGEPEMRSAISVPMVAGRGQTRGVLTLLGRKPNAFDQDDVSLASSLATQAAVAFENAYLFQATQSALEETDALYRASRAIAAADTVEEIIHAIVGSLTSAPIDECFLGIFDSPGSELSDELIVLASWSQAGQPTWSPGVQLSLGSDLIGERIRRDQPLVLSDVASEETLNDTQRLALIHAGVRSLAIVPLVAVGGLIGVLALAASETGAISQRDLQPYLTLAGQAALSIERSNLFKRTQAALEETEALYRTSAELNTAESYEDILAALRRHTILGRGSHNISLNLFDRPWTSDRQPEWIEVPARWTELPAENFRQRYPMATFPLAHQLLHPDAPTLVEEVAQHPAMDDNARDLYTRVLGARSTIFVPLLAGGQWIGFLNAVYKEPAKFEEAEVRRLTALSGQAAVAVQSLRQLQQIQARARREALIREITGKVRASTDLETILQTTVTELSQALGTFHGAIRLGTAPAEQPLPSPFGRGAGGEGSPSRTSPSSRTSRAAQRDQLPADDAGSPAKARSSTPLPPETRKGGQN